MIHAGKKIGVSEMSAPVWMTAHIPRPIATSPSIVRLAQTPSSFRPFFFFSLPLQAVHGFGGLWGVIATGLFASDRLVRAAYGTKPGRESNRHFGAFMGSDGNLLAAQVRAFSWKQNLYLIMCGCELFSTFFSKSGCYSFASQTFLPIIVDPL
jgi:hypothetical protein